VKLYNLPPSTEVYRNIPKNAFDSYANTKQKQMFTDLVAKITWKYKISEDTVNLSGNDIKEIQIFEIQLKEKKDISTILDIIDKSIPYHIIYVIVFQEELMFRTAKKHHHPTNRDNAVIEWNFKSGWSNMADCEYRLNLKKDIDFVFKDFCSSINNDDNHFETISEMITHQSQIHFLEKEIFKLKSQIKQCKQFNEKLDLNVQLNSRIQEKEKMTENKL